jgi:hypothetical protein
MLAIQVRSTAGQDIQECIREMWKFSIQNQVICEQEINGIWVWTYPESYPERVYAAYQYAQENGKKHAIVRS